MPSTLPLPTQRTGVLRVEIWAMRMVGPVFNSWPHGPGTAREASEAPLQQHGEHPAGVEVLFDQTSCRPAVPFVVRPELPDRAECVRMRSEGQQAGAGGQVTR